MYVRARVTGIEYIGGGDKALFCIKYKLEGSEGHGWMPLGYHVDSDLRLGDHILIGVKHEHIETQEQGENAAPRPRETNAPSGGGLLPVSAKGVGTD